MSDLVAYEFGPYRLEGSTRRLSRGDELIPLAPKAFDILLALIDRRDRVVDKAELMKLVWPDSFVEEANLSQTIFVLRKTLGDDPGGNPYIETVPRRGYRFAAEVREVEPVPAAAAVASKRKWVIAAAAILAVTIVAVAWVFRGRETVAPDNGGITRIAVLPFENLTSNVEDQWLSSAFSDSLTSGLEGAPAVITVSRDRIIELYRQEQLEEAAPVDSTTLRRLADRLGLRYYVHGTYQRVGDQLRVVARLVDIEAGTNEAQETITDRFANVLKIQDDLATRFGVRLAGGPRVRLASSETPTVDAYRAAVLGHNAYATGEYVSARRYLEEAVARDPRYARAWALLSKTLSRMASASVFTPGSASELRALALANAERSVALDANLLDGRLALALAYRESGNAEGWRREAEAAVAIAPQHAEAHELLGDWNFAAAGSGCSHGLDAALADEHLRTALRIDPRHGPAWANLIYHLHFTDREDEAVRVGDEALKVLPDNMGVRRARATALMFANRIDESEAVILAVPEASRGLQDRWMLASIALFRGETDFAAKEFEEVAKMQTGTTWELSAARSYVFAKDLVRAMTHVERAVAINPDCARYAAVVPAFAPLQRTRAFQARLAQWNRATPQ
jgi:DNA-binding winged helix-turn-helix (wHTH) protein/TolB-like protein/Tfp pilus assembly protein PilF